MGDSIPPTPLTAEALEQLFTQSQLLQGLGFQFEKIEPKIWQITYKNSINLITFYPEIFEQYLSLQLMGVGNPLFDQIIATQSTSPDRRGL